MHSPEQLAAVAAQFEIGGRYRVAQPYGNGHINDTYCAVFESDATARRYILQRINHNVFRNPVALMENVERVTRHLAGKLAGQPDAERQALRLIPTRAGQAFHRDAEGNFWRGYLFIEGARSHDTLETTEQAFAAARAFGTFQRQLADLPAPRLHDTIPDFHHTPRRFDAFAVAVARDVANRAARAKPEIEFALRRQPITAELLSAQLPERVTHNDTKLNNVMLDDTTGEGVCVIDLDTVMPGLALYDFGDLVRTTTSPAREDERDLTRVQFRLPMFEALVRGYLDSADAFLTSREKSYLAFAGRLITFEIGLRFLTDFLDGDTYFKVHRDGHNLDRCRTQFRLVEAIEREEDAMARFVQRQSA